MCLDGWLVHAFTCQQCKAHLNLCLWPEKEGFLSTFLSTHLMPTQIIIWPGMECDSCTVTLRLSLDNYQWILSKVHSTLVAQNISWRLWESPLSSLYYAAQVLPLGPIRLCRLSYESNCLFPADNQYRLVPLQSYLRPLIQWWLHLQLLY